jgi:hypothetical protein
MLKNMKGVSVSYCCSICKNLCVFKVTVFCIYHGDGMMEAAYTLETSIYFYETTQRYSPKGCDLHTRRRENLTFQSAFMLPFCCELEIKRERFDFNGSRIRLRYLDYLTTPFQLRRSYRNVVRNEYIPAFASRVCIVCQDD